MNPTSGPSPQLFFDTITAYQRTGALKAALDLQLFAAIGQTPATASEVAERCGCPERGIRILCDSLAIFGFLTKDGGRFALTPDSALFLNSQSPAYIGAAADFLLSPGVADGFTNLAKTIKSGKLHQSEQGTIEANHPVWIQFARSMGGMMAPTAAAAAELVSLDAQKETKVLDIAASHAAYGIAWTRKYPKAHLVALDWEPVLAVATENAKAAGVADRFSTITGDAFTVDLGSDYDVVLVPNFLHHFNLSDCVRFLKRVHAALRPGGHVVIIEFVPNEDRVTPPGAASFSIVMLGTTPEGDAYTFAEYQGMLAEAGFHEPKQHVLPPGTESAVIAVR